jgi:hypothetical protein
LNKWNRLIHGLSRRPRADERRRRMIVIVKPIKRFINQIDYASLRRALVCVTVSDSIWSLQGW